MIWQGTFQASGAVEDPALCNAISAGECEEAKDCDSSASSSLSSESSSSVQEERMMDQVNVARLYEIDKPWANRVGSIGKARCSTGLLAAAQTAGQSAVEGPMKPILGSKVHLHPGRVARCVGRAS